MATLLAARSKGGGVRRWLLLGEALLYLLPSLGLFGLFVFYPAARSIYLSTYATDALGRPKRFIGMENFTSALTDHDFLHALWTSMVYVLYTVPIGIAIGLLLALLANRQLKGMRIFQVLFSSTICVSVATGSTIWGLLYHPSGGMLNHILALFGLPKVAWLTSPAYALIAVSLVSMWIRLGFNFVLMLSGLTNIPEEMYEAAKIDGASWWRQIWHVTLPLLSPTLFFASTVGVIHAFQAFGEVQLLTSGGPAGATNVVVFQIYQEAFVNFHYGAASAQSLILFAIILVFTGLQFRLERKVHYH